MAKSKAPTKRERERETKKRNELIIYDSHDSLEKNLGRVGSEITSTRTHMVTWMFRGCHGPRTPSEDHDIHKQVHST